MMSLISIISQRPGYWRWKSGSTGLVVKRVMAAGGGPRCCGCPRLQVHAGLQGLEDLHESGQSREAEEQRLRACPGLLDWPWL